MSNDVNSGSRFLIAAVLVFGFFFFVPTIINIWHLFKVPQLITHPFITVISLFLFAVLLRIYLEKHHRLNMVFIPDALIVVALIGMLLEVPHIKEFFYEGFKEAIVQAIAKPKVDLSGDWTYEVRDLDNNAITHSGICTIKQEGNEIYIHGLRKQSRDKRGQLIELNPGIPWHTQFGHISATLNPKLTFLYEIEVSGDRPVEGYCVLDLPDTPVNTMYGEYTHLAPNKLRGHLEFKRSKPGLS